MRLLRGLPRFLGIEMYWTVPRILPTRLIAWFPMALCLFFVVGCDVGTMKTSTPVGSAAATKLDAKAASPPVPITIGSKAPSLDIAHWVQTGNGKFKPVTKLENGKVYVVEFWATWCGPCVATMPHLVEIQKQYDSGNVQIVSVSSESLEEVDGFLAKEAGERDGKPFTYRELTSDYCLTVDPDESTSIAYFDAAGLRGIPAAFIVGKDGFIEWIGHPGEMDEPLAAVVDGSWNRQAFAEIYQEEKDLEALGLELGSILASNGNKEPAEKQVELAIHKIQSFADKAKSKHVLSSARFMLLDIYTKFRPNDEKLLPLVKEVFEAFAEMPSQVDSLAWGLYELSQNGQLKNDELLNAALDAAKASIDIAKPNQRFTILDTIAHLQEQLGDLDGALQSAKDVAQSDRASDEQKRYVEKLEKAIEENKK
jgi:thiol-disulfide isomerase/thioredoxin